MPPLAAFDCRLNSVGCCTVRQHYETIAEVLVNVAAHECIQLVASGGNVGGVYAVWRITTECVPRPDMPT